QTCALPISSCSCFYSPQLVSPARSTARIRRIHHRDQPPIGVHCIAWAMHHTAPSLKLSLVIVDGHPSNRRIRQPANGNWTAGTPRSSRTGANLPNKFTHTGGIPDSLAQFNATADILRERAHALDRLLHIL